MNLQSVKNSVMKFIKDEEGLTIVEYAVAGGLVVMGAGAAFSLLGQSVDTAITDLNTCVATPSSCPDK